MTKKAFKILSIDGGGIRGVFPAMLLANYEAELKSKGVANWQVYQNFDLLAGTSTGGILAIALALGIPAQELYELYLTEAKNIFGKKKGILEQIKYASHERDVLERLIRDKFKETNSEGKDPILKDCKTNVCIPIFDLLHGKPSVLKNNYHPRFTRDYHIPAYQAALATSAAPTFFTPFGAEYKDLNGVSKTFNNKVDGGVFANNPALLAIIEAQEAFKQELSDLKVLSIGTGHQRFSDGEKRQKWGLHYWMLKDKKRRIIDLFMQGQSQLAENLISLMQNGIDKEREDNPSFIYHRINTELDSTLNIAMDETNRGKLEALAEKASFEFSNYASKILRDFSDYKPSSN